MLFENKGCVLSNSVCECVQRPHAQSCYQKVKNVLCRGISKKSVFKFLRQIYEIGSLLITLSDSYL